MNFMEDRYLEKAAEEWEDLRQARKAYNRKMAELNRALDEARADIAVDDVPDFEGQ